MSSSKPHFPAPKPPDLGTPPTTYASVVSAAGARNVLKPRFPPLVLPARQVGSKEGKPSISFSGAEIGACEKRFEHSIIAKFTAGRPRLAEIQRAFQAAWTTAGRVSISEIWDSRHMLVIFDSENDVRVALASPLNKVGHALFRLFRWHPEYNPRRESAITTIWLRLPGLPISIYDPAFIEAIVSTFGYFVSVDERTKACTALNYARVCVELDITKEIPNAVWVNMPGNKSYWQSIEIESKIAFCSKCRIHGHSFDSCRKRKEWRMNNSTKGFQADPLKESEKILEIPKETRNLGGVDYEWRKVTSSRKKKTQGEGSSKACPLEDNIVPGLGDAAKALGDPNSQESQGDNMNKALVVYVETDEVKSNGKLNNSASGAPGKVKKQMSFANFVPKDLSGAERRIRNKATNVLIFNEDLGVFAHPEALAHYQQIQDKAGTARCDHVGVDTDSSDVDEAAIIIIEGEGSTSSKHYSPKVSK